MVNQLAALRKQKNLTQRELAESAGITRNYISKLEHAKEVNVSLKILSAIAKKLDVTISDIFLD